MVFTGIFLATLIGFLLINNISPKFNLCEKIGWSFPLGMACVTMIMFFLDAVNLPFTRNTILIGMLVLIVAIAACFGKNYKIIFEELKKSFKISFGNYNIIWLILIILIIYMENMNFQRCIFWPTYDIDSVCGYETIGYIMSKEFTLKGVSVIQPEFNNLYTIYTPFVQLCYGFIYIFGAEMSKIIPGLMYAFFLLAFYGVSKRAINRTGAAMITFFVLITPEMLAFSALSMTNVMHAIFAATSIVYLSIWFKQREKKDLFLSAILLAINVWCRIDGFVFVGAACVVLFVDMLIKKQHYKQYIFAALISLSTIIIWNIFLKIYEFPSDHQNINMKPFWDAERAHTIWKYMKELYTSTLYYGLTFIVFLLGFLGNLWSLIKKRDNIYLLVMLILSMVFFITLLYQLNNTWDTIDVILMYSAKRFMFCFIPIIWFYVASNESLRWLLDKTEKFLALKK
jgi:hypothetical protein